MDRTKPQSISKQITGSHDETTVQICPPVKKEVEDELSLLAEIPGVANDIANNQIWSTLPPPTESSPRFIDKDLYKICIEGIQARTVIKRLGCSTCASADICLVGDILENRAAIGERATAYNDVISMLVNAPIWLKNLRLKLTGPPPPKDEEINEESLTEPQRRLANVLNEPLNPKTIGDMPSIKAIDGINKKEPIQGYRIKWLPSSDESSQEKGSQRKGEAEVYDARDLIPGIRRFTLGEKESNILFEKLVEQITQIDSNGHPQIETPDHNITKIIKRWNGEGRLIEVRMSGKDRLYITVEKSRKPDIPITRIVIIGEHGGNDDTQRDFLAALLPL